MTASDQAALKSTTTTVTSATATAGLAQVTDVTIHPLVLLSAADHYHRVARGTRKRVVGVLLGRVYKGNVDATNSFAVPFEEDSRNPAVFYLDHNYLESMLFMFRKINAKERVVGFYSTGPSIRPNDLRIHDICQRFAPASSVFCIIDVRPDRPALPVTAYKVVEEVSPTQAVQRSFAHLPVGMGAIEAEEVGVEHLLRDINDPTVSTVASLIQSKLSGLETLAEKLRQARDYLLAVSAAGVTPNPVIVANLQTIFNLLPNLDGTVRSMMTKTNDMHMAVYLGALIRSVMALHDLVNNKIRHGQDLAVDTGEEKKDDAATAGVALVAEKKTAPADKEKDDQKK